MALHDEELGYVSTSPFLSVPPETKAQDEIDKPTLVRVQDVLQGQIDRYGKVSAFDVGETDFTVKEQLAMAQQMVVHLTELQELIKTTLSNIKEKYNG